MGKQAKFRVDDANQADRETGRGGWSPRWLATSAGHARPAAETAGGRCGPGVDIVPGDVGGVEALFRVQHGDRGRATRARPHPSGSIPALTAAARTASMTAGRTRRPPVSEVNTKSTGRPAHDCAGQSVPMRDRSVS